jgi:hypothetical protein
MSTSKQQAGLMSRTSTDSRNPRPTTRARLAISAWIVVLCFGFAQPLGSTPPQATTLDSSHFDLIDWKLDNLSTQLDQLRARIRASHTSATAIDNTLSSINDRLSSIQVSLFVVVGIVLLNIRMQR